MTTAASLLIATLLSAPAAQPAAAGGVLQVSGTLPKSGSLSISDLEAMGPVTSAWTLHGEKREVYGVPVDKVLSHFGFEPGPMGKSVPKQEKRKGWRMVVIATAADEFQAVLSCAEVFESMGPTKALLVWKIDGKPLQGEQGPLRLVVLTDKEPSRSIYGVRALEVVEPRGAPAASTLR
jgi:DMSO/TMAO reductase YedYZ molybdopterin-dependent catalytic subunit